eukprot:scaffold197757_cov27-Tisochrysis_lutea.AAC.2
MASIAPIRGPKIETQTPAKGVVSPETADMIIAPSPTAGFRQTPRFADATVMRVTTPPITIGAKLAWRRPLRTSSPTMKTNSTRKKDASTSTARDGRTVVTASERAAGATTSATCPALAASVAPTSCAST